MLKSNASETNNFMTQTV